MGCLQAWAVGEGAGALGAIGLLSAHDASLELAQSMAEEMEALEVGGLAPNATCDGIFLNEVVRECCFMPCVPIVQEFYKAFCDTVGTHAEARARVAAWPWIPDPFAIADALGLGSPYFASAARQSQGIGSGIAQSAIARNQHAMCRASSDPLDDHMQELDHPAHKTCGLEKSSSD